MQDLMSLQDPGWVGGPAKPLPAASAAADGVLGQGPLVTLLQFQPDITEYAQSADPSHAKLARLLTRSPRVLTASVFAQGGTGPLIGVAQWGSGNGAQQSAEFDLPTAGFGGSLLLSPNTLVDAQGGVILSVPATSLNIVARNDANLIPPGGAQALGAAPPFVALPQATASIGIGQRGNRQPLTRTTFAVFDPAGAGLAPAGTVLIFVPPWSKRGTIFLRSAAQTATATIVDILNNNIAGPYTTVASTAPVPFDIPPTAGRILLTNTGAGAINVLGVVFELGL